MFLSLAGQWEGLRNCQKEDTDDLPWIQRSFVFIWCLRAFKVLSPNISGGFPPEKMHFSLQFNFMVEVLNVLPVSSFPYLLYKRNTGKGTKCAQCPWVANKSSFPYLMFQILRGEGAHCGLCRLSWPFLTLLSEGIFSLLPSEGQKLQLLNTGFPRTVPNFFPLTRPADGAAAVLATAPTLYPALEKQWEHIYQMREWEPGTHSLCVLSLFPLLSLSLPLSDTHTHTQSE